MPNSLVSLALLAAPVFGAYQLRDVKSQYTRAGNGTKVEKLLSKLYVSSFDGNVTSFALGASGANLKQIHLAKIESNPKCGKQPTWLTYDSKKRELLCLNEAWNPADGKASLTKYHMDREGKFKHVKTAETSGAGPTHMHYHEGKHIIAHYEPGGISIMDKNLGRVGPLYNVSMNRTNPPKPNQLGSHVHQILIDPSTRYYVAIDLGQDLIVTNEFLNQGGNNWGYAEVKKGTGPRHGVFAPFSGSGNSTKYAFYVAGEISNTIEGFEVTYDGGKMKMDRPLPSISATQAPFKEGYSTAELALSPDRQFIIVSNRNNSLATVQNCDINLANCKDEKADTLVTFKPKTDGSLEHIQTWSAGGELPRSFSLNAKGDMIAVGLKDRLAIMERDPITGKIGQIIHDAPFAGAVSNIVWDHEGCDTRSMVSVLFGGQFNVFNS